MRNLIALCIAVLCFGNLNAQVKKILFLGNSYTYVNDLPQVLKKVALSFDDTIYTDQNTPGGYQFSQHITNGTSLAKIASNNWDFVVLQEQSQKPSFPPSQVETDVYPYAKILNDSIKSNYSCTETVFFMTWGRENGDAANCASYTPLCTYEGMQQRLRESYMEMADSNKSTTAPVGVAWKKFRDSFPSIGLYSADESHPSIYGTYLAACVFYVTCYQKSAIGATYIPVGINSVDALRLQTVATNTVLDSLSLWRINANKPVANFTYNGGGAINFNNTSTNGLSYFWDFGDGNTSQLQHPSNIYTSNNTYNVELITFSKDSCFSDTITQSITVASTGIADINKGEKLVVYPNPAVDFVELKTNIEFTHILIVDVMGSVVKQMPFERRLNIKSLAKGIYFIKLVKENNTIVTKKFIKQ